MILINSKIDYFTESQNVEYKFNSFIEWPFFVVCIAIFSNKVNKILYRMQWNFVGLDHWLINS